MKDMQSYMNGFKELSWFTTDLQRRIYILSVAYWKKLCIDLHYIAFLSYITTRKTWQIQIHLTLLYIFYILRLTQ